MQAAADKAGVGLSEFIRSLFRRSRVGAIAVEIDPPAKRSAVEVVLPKPAKRVAVVDPKAPKAGIWSNLKPEKQR